MSAAPQDTTVITFAPRPGAMKNAVVVFACFVGFACLNVVGLFMKDDNPSFGIHIRYVAMFSMVMFSLFAVLSWKRVTAARRTYALDSEGIWIVGEHANRVRWDGIADVEFKHAMNLGELTVTLRDAAGKPCMSIGTEPLARGGRGLVELLFLRLRPVIEARAREYLSGQKTWKLGLLKDPMRIDGEMLYLHFPAGKKHAIPLRTISRVEWLPGAISGAKKGFVIVEHPGGAVELPQMIPGMQHFLFALKYLCGLGDRVNPQMAGTASEKVDKVRTSQLWVFTTRVLGIGLCIGAVILFGRMFMRQLDDNGAKMIGKPAEATVVKRNPAGVEMTYRDLDGREWRATSRIDAEARERIKIGDKLQVTYNPAKRDAVWFEGKQSFGTTFWLVFSGSCLATIAVGALLIIFSYRRQRKDQERIREIEQKAGATAMGPPALPPPPPTYGFSVPPVPPVPMAASVADGPTRMCTGCAVSFAGSYYLSDGKPYCPACHNSGSVARSKPTKLALFQSLALGIIGGIVAGGIWATVTLLTGYEIGIVAVLVGLVVGFAVKLGAKGYGGRSLQFLAVILTLFTLSYAMIPIAIGQVMSDPEMKAKLEEAWNQKLAETEAEEYDDEEVDEIVVVPDGSNTGTTASAHASAESPEIHEPEQGTAPGQPEIPQDHNDADADAEEAPVAIATPAFAAMPEGSGAISAGVTTISMSQLKAGELAEIMKAQQDERLIQPENWGLGKWIGFLAVLLVALILAPVAVYLIMLFTEPISGLFLAIALWEAWRINRPEKRTFLGPYTDEQPISFDKADFTTR